MCRRLSNVLMPSCSSTPRHSCRLAGRVVSGLALCHLNGECTVGCGHDEGAGLDGPASRRAARVCLEGVLYNAAAGKQPAGADAASFGGTCMAKGIFEGVPSMCGIGLSAIL